MKRVNFYMITENLVQNILIDPILNGADELCISAGYATPNMVLYFISNIPDGYTIKLHLIVGMIQDNGISLSVHEGFKDLIANLPNTKISQFECSYVYKNAPVCANMFIWKKQGVPFCAFGGSANFTQSSFYLGKREVMFEINASEAMQYYNSFIPDTIYATHSEIEEFVVIYSTHPILDAEDDIASALESSDLPRVNLSLLAKNGETGTASGLNWGQRKGREPNQAYIPVSSKVKKTGFFPPPDTVFTALTDDRKCLLLRIEQQGDKAIATPTNNSLLGEYIRNRIGLSNGQYVWRKDLERYGRTDVTFYKLDENQYFMDFGV